MDQSIVNGLFAAFGGLVGFLLNVIWQAVKDLQKADKELADKVAAIEILVAGQYIHRSEFERLSDAIFAKLDKIENKLDGKADKP